MSWLTRLAQLLPWAKKDGDTHHAELERELQELDSGPVDPAASAADAMAEMKARSKAAKPAPSSARDEDPAGPENTELRERWRQTAPEKASNEELRKLKR